MEDEDYKESSLETYITELQQSINCNEYNCQNKQQ